MMIDMDEQYHIHEWSITAQNHIGVWLTTLRICACGATRSDTLCVGIDNPLRVSGTVAIEDILAALDGCNNE